MKAVHSQAGARPLRDVFTCEAVRGNADQSYTVPALRVGAAAEAHLWKYMSMEGRPELLPPPSSPHTCAQSLALLILLELACIKDMRSAAVRGRALCNHQLITSWKSAHSRLLQPTACSKQVPGTSGQTSHTPACQACRCRHRSERPVGLGSGSAGAKEPLNQVSGSAHRSKSDMSMKRQPVGCGTPVQ
eukprot:scaffold105328_cov18-Tisochrysis_lutea.AAC.3